MTIVIDENLFQLVEAFKDFNIHVVTPLPGMSDKDIVTKLLTNRILLTNNTKDFLHYAPTFDIGIISLQGLKFIDPNTNGFENQTVKIISDAIIQFQCWSKRTGFLLEIKEDGKHQFTDFVI